MFLFMKWWCSLTSLIYKQLTFQTPFAEETVFPHCIFLSPLLKLIDHRCVGSFLGSLFYSIAPYVFVPIPCYFDYCSILVMPEVWECYDSWFVLFSFFSIAVAILDLSWLNINSFSVKNVTGYLIGIALNMPIALAVWPF